MLSYEICKKIKEAGYLRGKETIPSLNFADSYYTPEKKVVRNPHLEYVKWEDFSPGIDCRIIELPELIEMCGEAFSHVKKLDGNWWALSEDCEHSKDCDCINNIEEMGATPEEAVARLWLSLNKKE